MFLWNFEKESLIIIDKELVWEVDIRGNLTNAGICPIMDSIWSYQVNISTFVDEVLLPIQLNAALILFIKCIPQVLRDLFYLHLSEYLLSLSFPDIY